MGVPAWLAGLCDAAVLVLYFLGRSGGPASDSIDLDDDGELAFTLDEESSSLDLVLLAGARLLVLAGVQLAAGASLRRVFFLVLWIAANGGYVGAKTVVLAAGGDALNAHWAVCLLSVASIVAAGFELHAMRAHAAARGEEDEAEKLLDELTEDFERFTERARAVWQDKWDGLLRQFRPEATPSAETFYLVLRLYASHDVADELLSADPIELEFYTPQLLTFLLWGSFEHAEHLRACLLSMCGRSVHFAHLMHWFLRAAELDAEPVLQLAAEVGAQGQAPAQQLALSGPVAVPAPAGDVESQPDWFQAAINFVEELTAVSAELLMYPRAERKDELRTRLAQVESRHLPSSCVYVPVGNVLHRVLRLHADESFPFSTKERVPYLVCLEVVDYAFREPAHQQQRRRWWQPPRTMTLSIGSHTITVGLGDVSIAGGSTSEEVPEEEKGLLLNGHSAADGRPLAEDLGQWAVEPRPRANSRDSNRFDTGGSAVSLGAPAGARPRSLSADAAGAVASQMAAEPEPEPLAQVPEAEAAPVSSPTAKSDVIFPERWANKEARIRAQSEYGGLPGWRLLPVIVKSNDDLRQEQFASQLLHQFARVFAEERVPVWMRPYDIVATGPSQGLIEAVPDTVSIDALKRNNRQARSLRDFFVRFHGPPASQGFKRARENFVRSMAAYSIVCYLLQVKDRHNGNILLDAEGHIVHIDFGFFLGIAPGGRWSIETSPFKLTTEFVELMDGPRSSAFRLFRDLCVKAFMAARKQRERIILTAEMFVSGGANPMPCFGSNPRAAVDALRDRFNADLSDHACRDFVHDLIDQSVDSWQTRWYDRFQRVCVGIF